MEAILAIWIWLTKTLGLRKAVVIFVSILIAWGLYWHVFRPPLDTIGEWVDWKLRTELSMPPKEPNQNK